MSWFWISTAALLVALLAMLRQLRAGHARLARERSARQNDAVRLAQLGALLGRKDAILQQVKDGFFILDDEYRFKEVNAAFCRMTGYTTEELLRMRMTDLEVAGGGNELRGQHWGTAAHHFATAHRHKLGHLIYLETGVVVFADGPLRLLVGFARDITERCRSEQALRDSEHQYRNLVEMSRDLIWSLDLDCRWTFVNSAARAIYGQEPDAMLGQSLMDYVRPELHAATRALLDELKAGKPRVRFETEHLRGDGAQVNLSVSAIAVRDEQGQVVGFTGTSSDITDRKQAEKQLREAHARFESLVAGMPLGYIVWSPEFRALEWNPAATAIYGYRAEEALGKRAIDLLIPSEARLPFAEMCRGLLNGTARVSTVLSTQRRDGEKIRSEWYATVLRDARGGVAAIATLVRDVSERERLESQLRQSQKLESLGVLAGGVAHDFNNLLVGIMGNASLAIEQLPADSPLRPQLERVVNAGRRATDLTQRMLAYAGRATCDVQIMDLNALVREMADFALAGIPKTVSLQVDTAADLPLVKADSGQVQQVIMNLLINAAEAIGDRVGEVQVRTWLDELTAERLAAELPDQKLTPGNYVGLEVRDNGCGMTPEILSRIFDPFFSTKFAGRGLGLSAILGIVKAHHGAITVSSRVGVGTVFRVYFPAVAGRGLKPATRPQSRPLPRGSTVLVIDDEEDIRDVVDAVLSSRGIHVLAAEDGRRGIELFRAEADRVDVVLLDMNMPGLNGEAVFRELIAIRPDVKVLLSTGYSEQEAASHFTDAPLAGFVHKPYTASALVDKLGTALGAN